jgi:hypothetical protein
MNVFYHRVIFIGNAIFMNVFYHRVIFIGNAVYKSYTPSYYLIFYFSTTILSVRIKECFLSVFTNKYKDRKILLVKVIAI